MFVYCLAVIATILLIVERWKPTKFDKIHRQLGNDFRYYPIIGNALPFMGSNEDIMKCISQLHKQAWKRKHNALSAWIGHHFFVLISDADKACTALKSALDMKYVNKFSNVLLGNGSVFARVDVWHRRRKILGPIFAPRYINNFVRIFEAHSKVTADLLESKVGKGNVLCYDYFCPYALDSVCETLFGGNIDAQRSPDHELFNALKDWDRILATRLAKPLLHIDAIYKLLPIYARQMRVIKKIYEFVDDVIQKKKEQVNRRKETVEQSDTTGDKSKTNIKSFLELMIENSGNTDKAYTNEELREETIVLAIAGTDTLAVGICFTILLLSQHADVQDKVYKEIHEVLGDSNKPLQFEDLHNLKYTRAVIKESLRLYPPGPFIIRNCNKDLQLTPDLTLPEDCNILISVWDIQRKPEYWGEDANYFRPDRFLSGKIKPNAFLTFSHSVRNCIGQQYAMLSMTTTLVTLLRRYRFTPAANFEYDEDIPLRLSFDVMMKHVDNFPVQIEYRDKC